MPRPLPASPQPSLEQIEDLLSHYLKPSVTAEEMYTKIQEANANLAALNLDRSIICLNPDHEERLIAAAETSLAFLENNQVCFATQQSLAKQLGIYYAYYKSLVKQAQTNFVIFMHNSNKDTLDEALSFLYLAYSNALKENFHEESHLLKAVQILDALAGITPMSFSELTPILVEKGHATFLLGLFNYRKSYLLNAEDKASYLEKAAAFLQQAIHCQTEVLNNTEDDVELITQALYELTISHRLACVIHYKMNDRTKTAEALKNSLEIEEKAVSNIQLIAAKGCSVRVADLPDIKVRREFDNINLAATLNTGSTPTDAGMFHASIQIPTATANRPSALLLRQSPIL
jgi:tetratricopeptide (TPR) repeat protein